MSACDYMERVGAYHDGELSADEGSAFEGHLRGCPACSAELARLRELSGMLAAIPVPRASLGFPERLRAGLRSTRDREIIRICRIASMAAAALLTVCVISLWGDEPSAPAGVRAPDAWEVAAVTLDADLAQADWGETFAVWVVEDLSRENGT
jgi:anti-sigma factor RsiW